jgi:hypothetical protein
LIDSFIVVLMETARLTIVHARSPTRAAGANANATAFQLATNKIVADHPGIAAGWPSLAAAAII